VDQANSLRKYVNKKVTSMNKKAARKMESQHSTNQTPRVVAVTSGKGGVGKTNIVGNLAVAFASLGKKVMILDADLGLANIDIIMGLNPIYNMGHVINGEKTISDVIINGPKNIKIIPAGSGLAELTQLTEGQKLNLLTEFETLDEMIDIFLIDTGAGISSNVLYFNLAADECIIVATNEPTSITDAYAIMKVMAVQHDKKYFKLLVNMAENEEAAKSVYLNLNQAAERFLNGVVIEYIGHLPSDSMVKKAVINQKTVLEMFPNAVSSLAFKKLAASMLETPTRSDSDGNIKFFLKRFIEYRNTEIA
jgi:flagellar biosynthesis protein FlhG